ncbi:MAG: 2-C-methyl-D-erythritol 4-phosphate cytidylyltransferase [Gammaproteobacteria bacterium]|jgi:2-C-methyl-D-erythritol 4-phosphate cytidylyltransferase|nr:2-C-methyl-D-erythritol 4-phosphate cytidylyltransferase [Gammaproteobacteria bacterium]
MPNAKDQHRFWAVVPAAGSGSRMGAEKPKQYLSLLHKTIIEHTLQRLLSHDSIAGLSVAIGAADIYWDSVQLDTDKTVVVTEGGQERCHSVINALNALNNIAAPQDWVLVHDAARPCVRMQDIDKMIQELKAHPVGGILAVPVHDTIKRSSAAGDIVETVDRRNLWQAQTPQMFRLQALRAALQQAIEDGFMVTDEASAMEHSGLKPKLVEGHADNIKVTRPEDLPLAEFYLKSLYL